MKPTEIPGSTTPGPMCCRRSCRWGVGLRWGWGGRDGLLCTWAGGRVAFLWVGMLGSRVGRGRGSLLVEGRQPASSDGMLPSSLPFASWDVLLSSQTSSLLSLR